MGRSTVKAARFLKNGNPVVSYPYIQSGDTLFEKSTIIALSCDEENAEIYYTLDGSEPTNQSRLYTKPFHVSESCLMKINAFKKRF
ncbi:MAG: chitobiase/beta-hexosaminidase C-terminal domain-containing protein [Draconibacterium sp.]